MIVTLQELRNSAVFLAKTYQGDHLVRALIKFDEREGRLFASCVFDRVPTEEDKEDCELFCGELVGEFPEIRTAEATCSKRSDDLMSDAEYIEVFSR